MPITRSKISARGQVRLPAEVKRKLGVEPGSILEWDEVGGTIVVRRAGKYTFEDIHKALFPEGAPKPRTLAELKEGLRQAVRKRHLVR